MAEEIKSPKKQREQENPAKKVAYSVKEAGAALGVCESSIWKAIKRGDLIASRLGNRTLIAVGEVEACLKRLANDTAV